jgi:hypothetical protein
VYKVKNTLKNSKRKGKSNHFPGEDKGEKFIV